MTTTNDSSDCQFGDALNGRLNGRCPACGVDAEAHDRVCDRCGERMTAAEAEHAADGSHLHCDDCYRP